MIMKYNLLGVAAIALATIGSDSMAQTTYSWSPAGPVLSAGRSRNLVVDRNNSNVLYVGSVSSGIFKSTDGAANWAPLNDQGTVRNISYLAQSADGTLYAATGEGFLRQTARSRAQVGSGLYKLNGINLDQVQPASVTGSVITRIACHPTNAARLAIAGSSGLLISEDGGATFVKASGAIAPTATALTVAYDNAGNMYATATEATTGGSVKLFKSTGGSAAGFVDITPVSSLLPNSNYGRIEIGIANSNNATIYASCAKPTTPNSNGSAANLYGFFVSKDGGATWILILEGSPQLDPLSNGGSINSGDYAHCVLVNPLDENEVYVSGYRFFRWRKNQGGPEGVGSWVRFGNEAFFNTPLYLRQNIHDFKITTSGSSISAFYFVTDAGIYKSSDFLTTFQPFFKGLGTAQYNSISIASFPKSGNNNGNLVPYSGYIAGTGGNGISYFSGNYPLVTSEINYLTGDFFNVQYSRINPNTAFMAASNSNLYIAADVTTNDPNLMQVSHLGTRCGTEPVITGIDFRGISNNGSTTDATYANNTFTATGTPFRIWESDGTLNTVDSAIFYNDSVQVLIPVTNTVSGAQSYTLDLIKPQKSAILDKVVIRTFTVGIPSASSNTCFAFSNQPYTGTVTQKATMEFGGAASSTALPTSYTLTGLTTSTINALNTHSINIADNKDVLRFQLPQNPLTPIISFTSQYQYVRVGVTAFYHYEPNTKIIVDNGNISNKMFKDSVTLTSNLSWTFANEGTNSLTPVSTIAPIKFKMPANSRLAILNDRGVLVSKRPLNVNDPQKFQIVSCTGALTTNSSTYTAGQMTVVGTPYLLEWAPDGRSIYYVTNAGSVSSPTFNVYKVNVGSSIYDFSIDDYRGAFYTGCVNGRRNTASAFSFTTNLSSKFRTTLIGSFSERITSMSVSDNSSKLLLTTSNLTAGKRIYESSSNLNQANVDNTVVTFTDKTGNLPAIQTYCSLFEFTDNKRVLIGTENGIYATDDITVSSPNWFSAKNNQLPNVQVFDIKQQKLNNWESYNSGIIYVATNGRGAWVNKNFLNQTVIGVSEFEVKAKNTGLTVYPNPANSNVTLNFFAAENETVTVNIMDLNGRVVKSEQLGKLNSGYVDYTMDISNLTTGVYIVNGTGNAGIKRVTKLVVTK